MSLYTDELAICQGCARFVDPHDECYCDQCGGSLHEDCGEELPDGRFLCPSCYKLELDGELE